MLETPEARAKLRRKLETWPDDRESPVTINQRLELLNIIDKYEKALDGVKGLLDMATERASAYNKEADWMAEFLISQIKTCPTIKAYRCKHQDNIDFPVSECVKCWRDAVEQYVEWDHK